MTISTPKSHVYILFWRCFYQGAYTMVARSRLKRGSGTKMTSRLKRLFNYMDAKSKFQQAEMKDKKYDSKSAGPRYQIPALTVAGGKLNKKEDAIEFRVWVHPDRGDDYYIAKKTYYDAMQEWRELKGTGKNVEPVLAVVWDNKFQDFKEVQIPKKLEREW